MKEYTGFEDLEIWKEGMQLCIKVYQLMSECKDYGFKDQIQRASVSIPSNIAEGYERQTNKEFIHFLYISKGSCAEFRTQCYLAKKLNYINQDDFNILITKSKQLSGMLNNFIKNRKAYY